MSWLTLFAAIAFEVAGTSCIKLSNGFTKLWPVFGVFAFYTACFILLSRAMKSLDMGIAYAIWCGLGLVSICLIDFIFFHSRLNVMQWCSIALILGGIISLQLAG